MATDAASREVFDQLQERLRISRKRFDEWANRQSSLIQRSVEEHTRQIGNSKENIERCQASTAQLQWQSNENKRNLDERTAVLQALQEEINDLQNRGGVLNEQAGGLTARIAEVEKAVAAQKQASAAYVREADKDVSAEVNAYAKWLGLRFERMPGGKDRLHVIEIGDGDMPGVKLMFTNIQHDEPEKLFVAVVYVNPEGEYIGDFSKMVRTIRKRFVEAALSK